MRFIGFYILALFGILAASSIIPARLESNRQLAAPHRVRDLSVSGLFKRKGGGGGGGKGGSSGSSSSSSSSGSSGSSSSGARSGSSGSTSSSSTSTSASRGYGGGGYYGGGATGAYSAGKRTPKGLLPVGLLGVGALGFFGGAWLYGAYLYPYSNPYSFYNRTAARNETKPVQCLCQEYSACGCDDNEDNTFLNSVVGDGDPSKLNSSLIRVANVNGTDQIFLNGTLPNGTDTSAASFAGPQMKVPSTVGVLGLTFALACALASL